MDLSTGAGFFFFVFSITSEPALDLTQPPAEWVPGSLSRGVKRVGREANKSPSSSVKVKNERNCISTARSFLHGMHKGKFYLYLYLLWVDL